MRSNKSTSGDPLTSLFGFFLEPIHEVSPMWAAYRLNEVKHVRILSHSVIEIKVEVADPFVFGLQDNRHFSAQNHGDLLLQLEYYSVGAKEP
jgi:hypothetical protein